MENQVRITNPFDFENEIPFLKNHKEDLKSMSFLCSKPTPYMVVPGSSQTVINRMGALERRIYPATVTKDYYQICSDCCPRLWFYPIKIIGSTALLLGAVFVVLGLIYAKEEIKNSDANTVYLGWQQSTPAPKVKYNYANQATIMGGGVGVFGLILIALAHSSCGKTISLHAIERVQEKIVKRKENSFSFQVKDISNLINNANQMLHSLQNNPVNMPSRSQSFICSVEIIIDKISNLRILIRKLKSQASNSVNGFEKYICCLSIRCRNSTFDVQVHNTTAYLHNISYGLSQIECDAKGIRSYFNIPERNVQVVPPKSTMEYVTVNIHEQNADYEARHKLLLKS